MTLYCLEYNIIYSAKNLYYAEYNHLDIISFIKKQRKLNRMTQKDLAERAGVGIHFVRDLEQGKETLRMDKVNQILALFGKELGPVDSYISAGEDEA